MKKTVLIILFGMQLLTIQLFGQEGMSSPNESWNNGNYGEPDKWYSSNTATLNKYNLISVAEVPGITGSGVLLQTYIKDHDTIKAFISNTKGNAMKGQGGIPFSEKVVGMHGYYSYNLIEDDTARLLIVFKKKDTIVSTTNFKIKGNGKQPTYIPFTFPISLNIVPDTVIIETSLQSFLSSPDRKDGSYLELDSLYFIGIGKMIPLPNGNFENWVLHRRN
jgi:hypothetical protein